MGNRHLQVEYQKKEISAQKCSVFGMCSGKGISRPVKLPSSPWNLGHNKDWAMSADSPCTMWTHAATMIWRHQHMRPYTLGKTHLHRDVALGLGGGNRELDLTRKRSLGLVRVSCKDGQFCTRAASLGGVLAQLQLGKEPCTLVAECQESTTDELVLEWKIIKENGDKINVMGDRASLSAVSRALFGMENIVGWGQVLGPDAHQIELHLPTQDATNSLRLSRGVFRPQGLIERGGITAQSPKTMCQNPKRCMDEGLQVHRNIYHVPGAIVSFHQCRSWRQEACRISGGRDDEKAIAMNGPTPSGVSSYFRKQKHPGSGQFAGREIEDRGSKAQEEEKESVGDDDLDAYSGIAKDAQESLSMLRDAVSTATQNVDRTSVELSDLQSTFQSLLQSIKSMQSELNTSHIHAEGPEQAMQQTVGLQSNLTPDLRHKCESSTACMSGALHVYACNSPTSHNNLDSNSEDWTPREGTFVDWGSDSLVSSNSGSGWEECSQCNSSSNSYPCWSEADSCEDVLDNNFLCSADCSDGCLCTWHKDINRNQSPGNDDGNLVESVSLPAIDSKEVLLFSCSSDEIKLSKGSQFCDVTANIGTIVTQEASLREFSCAQPEDQDCETHSQSDSALLQAGTGRDVSLCPSTTGMGLDLRSNMSENLESCFEAASDMESVTGEDPILSLQSKSSDDSLTCLVEGIEGLVNLNPNGARVLGLIGPVERSLLGSSHVAGEATDITEAENETDAGKLSVKSDLLFPSNSPQETETEELEEVEGNQRHCHCTKRLDSVQDARNAEPCDTLVRPFPLIVSECQRSLTNVWGPLGADMRYPTNGTNIVGLDMGAECTDLELGKEVSPLGGRVCESDCFMASGFSQKNNAWECGLQHFAGPLQTHTRVVCATVGGHFLEGPDHGIRCDEVDLRLASGGCNSFWMTSPDGYCKNAVVCRPAEGYDVEEGVECMQSQQIDSNECVRIIITDVKLFLDGCFGNRHVRCSGQSNSMFTAQLHACAQLLAMMAHCPKDHTEESGEHGSDTASPFLAGLGKCSALMDPSSFEVEQSIQLKGAAESLWSPARAQESKLFPMHCMAACQLPNTYLVGVPQSLVSCPQLTRSKTMNKRLRCNGSLNSTYAYANGSQSLQSVDWSHGNADEEVNRLGAQHDEVLMGDCPDCLASWESGVGNCLGLGGARLDLENKNGPVQKPYGGMSLDVGSEDCRPFAQQHMGDLHSRYAPGTSGSAVMWSLQMELEHRTRDAGGRLPHGMCLHSTGPGACRFCCPEWRWQQLKGGMSCSLDLDNTGFWKTCLRRTCHACKAFVHWWTMRVEKCCGYATSTLGHLFTGPALKHNTKSYKTWTIQYLD